MFSNFDIDVYRQFDIDIDIDIDIEFFVDVQCKLIVTSFGEWLYLNMVSVPDIGTDRDPDNCP